MKIGLNKRKHNAKRYKKQKSDLIKIILLLLLVLALYIYNKHLDNMYKNAIVENEIQEINKTEDFYVAYSPKVTAEETEIKETKEEVKEETKVTNRSATTIRTETKKLEIKEETKWLEFVATRILCMC